MKSLCIVLLLGIGAQGQQIGWKFLFQPVSIPTALDDLVLSEIPDESAWGNQANGSCNMGQPVLVNPRAANETDGKPPKERDFLPNGVWPYTPKCPDGYRMGHYDATRERWEGDCVLVTAEPVDVPAVQRRVQDKRDHVAVCVESFSHHVWHSDGSVNYATQLPSGVPECGQTRPTGWITTYTCDPKSRILEHDENSPAKYWCRKVQPQ